MIFKWLWLAKCCGLRQTALRMKAADNHLEFF